MSIEEDDGNIIASDCPNRYCCQLADGCNYVDDFDDNLCAPHRDPSVPLCGKCEEGYSELLGTVNCGLCDRDYWEYLLIPVLIAIAFSVYLLCFDKSSVSFSGMSCSMMCQFEISSVFQDFPRIQGFSENFKHSKHFRRFLRISSIFDIFLSFEMFPEIFERF